MVVAISQTIQRQPRASSPGWRCALRGLGTALLALGLSSCGGGSVVRPASMQITLLGFNDFHGNLEPPKQAVIAQDARAAMSACLRAALPIWPRPLPNVEQPTAMWRWSRRGHDWSLTHCVVAVSR